MYSKENPEILTQMLIRKPVEVVFNAFVDPAITTKFWFTKSSGQLEEGKTLLWQWEMYNVKDEIEVLKIESNKLIRIAWGSPKTLVDFMFDAIDDNATYVQISNYNLNVSGEALVKAVRDLTGGFTTVLDGLKAYLEHGIELNLIGDKFLSK